MKRSEDEEVIVLTARIAHGGRTLHPFVGSEKKLADALKDADNAYRRRGRPGAILRSVSGLLEFGDSAVYDLQWRFARAMFFVGQEEDSRGAKRILHASGIHAGKNAVTIDYDGVEGHFWLGVNLALFAQASWGISGIKAIRKACRALLRAAEISPEYHGAGPLRVLGRLEHKAPWFLGGSRERSREYLDRALAIAPTNSVTLLYRAELAMDSGERDTAIALLEKIIANPIDLDWEFENRRDRKLAQAMLDRLRRVR